MRKGRLLGLVSVVALSLVASVPSAEAARAFTFVITGPGMRHAVTLRWDQMNEALAKDVARQGQDPLTGFHPFFHSVGKPSGSLGPAYDLKVFNFIPSAPPRSLGIEHWTYYPLRKVIRANDPRDPWLQPVPSLGSELDNAIAAGKGKNLVSAYLAATLIFLTMVALLVAVRRRRRAGRPLLSGASDSD